jgi:hypothetical protein
MVRSVTPIQTPLDPLGFVELDEQPPDPENILPPKPREGMVKCSYCGRKYMGGKNGCPGCGAHDNE